MFGAAHCLEHARKHGAALVFLSTSRVYSIEALRALPLERGETRFVLKSGSQQPGLSAAGIAEGFSTGGHRALYGTSKLAAELLIEEYRAMYGLRAIVNRCGVISGPWQMGKVDQGFFVVWLARHLYGGALSYMGFGGEGLQVRDILHVDDLYDLLVQQLRGLKDDAGGMFNVGGGMANSVSLRELTDKCRKLSGRKRRDRAHCRNARRRYSVLRHRLRGGDARDRLEAQARARADRRRGRTLAHRPSRAARTHPHAVEHA